MAKNIETPLVVKGDGTATLLTVEGTTPAGPGSPALAVVGTVEVRSRDAGSVAIGEDAASGQTSQTNVTAVGYQAAQDNTQSSLTAVGWKAGENNKGGDSTVYGFVAGQNNTSGNLVAVGHSAAQENTGYSVTAVGVNTAQRNTGGGLLAVGYQAGQRNSGDSTLTIGTNSGQENAADEVTAVGTDAARRNKASGSGTTAVGTGAGLENEGVNLTGIGFHSAQQNTGGNVTAIGAFAAAENLAKDVTAIGTYSGQSNIATAKDLVAVGNSSARRNTGTDVTAMGFNAAQNNSGARVTAIGHGTLRNSRGDNIVAVGADAQARVVDTAGAKFFVTADIDTTAKTVRVPNHGFGTAGDVVPLWIDPSQGNIPVETNGMWVVQDANTLAPVVEPDVTGASPGPFTITPIQKVDNVVAIGADAVCDVAQSIQLGSNALPFRIGVGNSGSGAAGQVLAVNAAGNGMEWTSVSAPVQQVHVGNTAPTDPATVIWVRTP